MVYFAYCTLLSLPEMQKQCPSAKLIGVGHLDNVKLGFASYSDDPNRGGCTYHEVAGAQLHGALYDVPVAELEQLHDAAGVSKGWYRVVPVHAITATEPVAAVTYLVNEPTGPFAPPDAYVAPILEGAKTLDLPEGYLSEISQIINEYQLGRGT